MGAGQSTRNIPDYVYVNFYIDEKEHIFVKFCVFNTENRYLLRKFMNNNHDIENSNILNSNCFLPNPINPKQENIYSNKTLEELLEERRNIYNLS
jgi:hypothetical protein